MTLPAQITTNLFSDFKNSFIGPFPKVSQVVQDTDNSVGQAIGSTNPQKAAQSFQVSEAGELTSVDLYTKKNNSPTDSIIVKICADNAGEPGTVLATGTSISVSTYVGTAFKYARSVFFLPPSLSTSTTYWITAERSGTLDATNHFIWQNATGNPYANGKMRTYNGSTWADVSSGNGDARFKVNVRVNGRYQPCVDKTNNKVRMFKSTDNGNTWSEQDSADVPSISSTANFKSLSVVVIDAQFQLFYPSGASQLSLCLFDTTTDQWSSPTNLTSVTLNTSVSGTHPALAGYRGNGEASGSTSSRCIALQGATETVMGSPRRRIKLKRRLGGASPAFNSGDGYDIVGSANTPDATLPGTAVDYDLRAVIVDGNDMFHMFWTQSDDSNIHHRQFSIDNAFSTANLMGSTAAVTSNSAAYPVGIGTGYFQAGDYYIALPYVDSGVIKVARCLASGAATAGNWTITSVVTATIETTNSNPCALMADNEQGGKLTLIYTKTDGKLYYTHDQASDTWVAEQELHTGTKTVGAISGGVLSDAMGICYLDTAPATDDLKFDSL